MNINRLKYLNSNLINPEGKCVVYWMSRDQRVRDNWAIVHAQEQAKEHNVPLVVVFALSAQFMGATLRQYDFMLRGLEEVRESLNALGIPFYMLRGGKKVPELLLDFFVNIHPVEVVCDFSPLRIARQWRGYVASKCGIRVSEVDAHNIVPIWIASDHEELAAHTLRPKLARMIDEYLEDIPDVTRQDYSQSILADRSWSAEEILNTMSIEKSVLPVSWIKPGELAAWESLRYFLSERIDSYALLRNDPGANAQSDLSPYLHFGQISAQRVAVEVMVRTKTRLRSKLYEATSSGEVFLEELIVRRELADNFCYYNTNYDNLEGAHSWARESLRMHASDKRVPCYSLEALEESKTDDELWNAAQSEMVKRGKMHGYMRMYWAKKILEWTNSPEEAIRCAIYLNDKYELDGRDPNGYVGIMWSIAGVHDRPWFDREIFGKIRYMSGSAIKRKFNISGYVEKK